MAFAGAVVLVMAASGVFVYLRLRADQDEAVNAELRARAQAVAGLMRRGGPMVASSTPLEDPEESFVQVLDLDGRLLDGAGAARGAVLAPGELLLARAGDAPATLERDLPGIDGRARLLVRAVAAPRPVVLVVGQSLVNRDDALRDARDAFTLAGPVAVLAASLLGYWLAGLGLAPVEVMRRAASDISARPTGRRLPLPRARDELRRLGETLNDMLERLERAFKRERRFVSDASHELRTPITVTRTELESALRSGDFGAGVGQAILAAIDECDALAQLADDLLLVASGDEHGPELLLEPVAVRALLHGVRDRFADRAAAHGRRLVVAVDADQVVPGDRVRLRQALGNLVDNALRHGAGTVTLRASLVAGAVAIDVCDQGPGFGGRAAAERAFDRFARGPGARGRGGAGLGLAIVRTLAEAHGGHAAIVGPPAGAGATVRVTLPAEPPVTSA